MITCFYKFNLLLIYLFAFVALSDVDAFFDFLDSDRSGSHFNLQSFYYEKNQPDQGKVNDGGGDKREERLVGSSAHNVTYSSKIGYRDISDDRGFFYQANQLAFDLRKRNPKRLRQNHVEERLGGIVAQSSSTLLLAFSYCGNTGSQNFKHLECCER